MQAPVRQETLRNPFESGEPEPQPHVLEALQNAWSLRSGPSVNAREALCGALLVRAGVSEAFDHLTKLAGDLPRPKERSLARVVMPSVSTDQRRNSTDGDSSPTAPGS